MALLTTGRLPVQLVPLVGRQSELRDVVDALSRGRLLTLTGPGGTGKTRLALAAADAARASYADGVCWVELAPIDDPSIVPLAVAGRLGARDSPGQDVTGTIAEHLGDRAMLIVLDNCEHLAEAAAELAHHLLGACPALSILATSREVLGVDGERQLAVPPLALPEDDITPAPSTLAEFDAVRFFEQRAQLVLPSFRLADDNAADVHNVCRRLDGLPLAIELAAARLRTLSVGQLAERLDDIFAVLVGGGRTAPRRHQTLRATLDWSHDLLADAERAVFRRLAVFAGGFTLGAAGPATGRTTAAEADAVPAGAADPAQRRRPGRATPQRPAPSPDGETGEADAAAAAGGPLRIRALGAATVHRGDTSLTAADWGYGKPRELLFLLATSAPMTREQLGVALWPDQSRQRLGNALHTALRELRRALGDPGWVLYVDGRYAFNVSREHDCDVETFEQALAAARRAQPASAALPDLQRAIAAYGGDFLADMAAGEWAQVRRDELRRSFEAALLATGRLHAAAGRYQAAVTAFRRAIADEPLNETAHRELMSSWARMGETARAVRHYRELAELLREQVGVPPAAETTALYRSLMEKR
jgi:DNA-binding SARP family transcriptional activator